MVQFQQSWWGCNEDLTWAKEVDRPKQRRVGPHKEEPMWEVVLTACNKNKTREEAEHSVLVSNLISDSVYKIRSATIKVSLL